MSILVTVLKALRFIPLADAQEYVHRSKFHLNRGSLFRFRLGVVEQQSPHHVSDLATCDDASAE